MSEAETSQGLALDPFGLLPGIASRIVGLGGSTAGHDASYAFHTPYVEVAPGYSQFLIRFEGLKARLGTLTLRVHMLPKDEGAHAILSTSLRASFNRIVQHGGTVEVRFEAFRNVTYALYGMIQGETDAEADAMHVILDRPAGDHETGEIVVDGRTSAYGRDAARPAAFMISVEPPSLARPTCQIATLPQLREQAARAWTERRELDRIQDPARRWSAAYILQALSRFGMLTANAHGLGVGWDAAGIAAVAADAGASVTVLDIAPDENADTGAGGTDTAGSAAPYAIVRGDPAALGPDIVNYDFAWTAGSASLLGSLADGIGFIREIVARLRPGGVVVHTFAFNLSSAETTIERGETVLYRRADLERIVLTMISLGHEAAQIRIDARDAIPFAYAGAAPDDPRATLCGIIVRKAATAL